MDALVIGGHYSEDRIDTMRHVDDFRLEYDGVPMTTKNLKEFFRNNRSFKDAERRQREEIYRPYRQIYYPSLHIYNYISQNGYNAALLNCHCPQDEKRFEVFKQNPKVVILSTTFMNMEAVRLVAKDIKQYLPDTKIIVGGGYVRHSYLIWQRIEDPYYNMHEVQTRYFFTSNNPVQEVDAYIFDEHGEETLLMYLDAVKKGKSIDSIPNIATYNGKNFVFNKEAPEEFNMNKCRIHWEKIPREYLSLVMPFSVTYGCPFKCNFWNFRSVSLSKKSLDTIFAELREISNLGIVQKIWFSDDNFLLTPKQVEQFCERYIQEGFSFRWMSFIRANSITSKTVDLMKKSNAELLVLGLESGSPTVLEAMNKQDILKDVHRAMSLLMSNNIDTEISFIIGHPGETDDTVKETIDFINAMPYSDEQIPYLYLFKFYLAPLSRIFEKQMRDQWGLEGAFLDWKHKTMASDYASAMLKKVALSVQKPVFNYLDGYSSKSKKELVKFMRKRDSLSRAVLSGKPDNVVDALWDELETLTFSRS